ncbi:MAG: LptF/LptG family permease [Thermoanaerobaculales bacterium]
MKLFGVVDRMVLTEVMPPAALGFLTYTFLVIMRGLFNLIEQVLVRGVPMADAGRVLLVMIPHVVVLTIPMSYLFGVLLGVGRMNADNEIIALQAGGVPARRMLRAIVLLGIVLTTVNAYLYMEVIPTSSRNLRELKIRLFTQARNLGRIEPKVFYEELPNRLIYIGDADQESGEWRNVVIYDSHDPGEERLTLAQRGRMVVASPRQQGFSATMPPEEEPNEIEQWILLENVVTHQISRADPETYRVNRNRSQLFRPNIGGGGTVRYRLAMRERSTTELVKFLQGQALPDGDDPSERASEKDDEFQHRQAAIELNKRLAIPFACIVFGLLALPLGVGARSGGRGRGFVISMAVVLSYYILNNYGELMATAGKIPAWVGIWLPNIVLCVVSLILMARMGRWLGEREARENLLARAVKRLKQWRDNRPSRASREKRANPVTGSIPLSIQRRRYATRFPTLFDRYLTTRLIPPLFMVMASAALLKIVIDLTSLADEMAKNDATARVILAYYANLIPQVFFDVTPYALLIAVLVLLTVLERQQELTALKAAGISLYRLAVPILLVAATCAGGLWVLGELVVPTANREAQRLLDRIKGRETKRSYRASDRQWLLSRDETTFYNFLRYDSPSQTLIRFTLFKLDEDNNLRFHLSAPRARYIDGAWIVDGGWYRQILPDGTDLFKRVSSSLELGVPEGPNYFGQEYRQPSEMTILELRNYIRELIESGYRPARLIVFWHQKFSYPLSAFIMVLLALPFGLNRGGRKVTTMQGVAFALGLGIGYFILVALFAKLGEIEVLPPAVGAWAPLVLAFLFAINRLTTLRT